MADEETTTTETTEISFSAEQSAKIGEIAARERRDGEAKGRKAALKDLLAELGVKDLDEVRAKLTAKPEPKPDDHGDLLAKRDAEWKAKLDEANRLNRDLVTSYQERDKRATLMDAAVKANAVDPTIVAQLCASLVGFNDKGELVVTSETGPRLNAKGDPLSPAELVAQYLAERPYLVKGSGTSGGGSGPNAGKAPNTDLETRLAAAQKAGNLPEVIALKRQIAESA